MDLIDRVTKGTEQARLEWRQRISESKTANHDYTSLVDVMATADARIERAAKAIEGEVVKRKVTKH